MSRSFIGPVVVLSAGVMTGTNKIVSTALDLRTVRSASFQAVWTGTPTGTFAIEGSMDQVTWSSMGITITAAAGAAGDRLVDVSTTAVPYIRMTYTNSSGSGTLTITGSGKGV